MSFYFGNHFSRSPYNNYYGQQTSKQKPQSQNSVKKTKRFNQTFFLGNSSEMLDFKKIRDEYGIKAGWFRFFGNSLQKAHDLNTEYYKNCQPLPNNNKKKKKCTKLIKLRTEVLQKAYTLLSNYIKQKSIKYINILKDSPQSDKTLYKLAKTLTAYLNTNSNQTYCKNNYRNNLNNYNELKIKFTNIYSNDTAYKILAGIFLDSLYYDDNHKNDIITALNMLGSNNNNKTFFTSLYNIINETPKCSN